MHLSRLAPVTDMKLRISLSSAWKEPKQIGDFKRMKGFDPFSALWSVYTVGQVKNTALRNVCLMMPGNVICTALIGQKLVLWLPFINFSPKLLGEFYSFSSLKDLKPLKLEQVAVTSDDLRAAYLAVRWDRAIKDKRAALELEFLALGDISPRFKATAQALYRGIQLTPEQLLSLESGSPLKLKPRLLTSWSQEKEVAEIFVKGCGVIVRLPKVATASVLVNLQRLDDLFKLPFQERLSLEHETLLKENGGIDTLTLSKNITVIKD